ncbi:site-specific integrase [Paraburkholderia sp. Se-20369]|nr:site-specific integrase [Paraburkholderia sp. Se-20369]
MSDAALVVDDIDEEIADWVIRRAKHPIELPSPKKSLVRRVLPEGFPIVIDERTGAICEPILLFIYDTFVKARNSKFVVNSALAYCFDVKEWMIYLEEFGLTWTQATPFNLKSYFDILDSATSPQTGKKYATETKNRRAIGIDSFYEWGRGRRLAADDTPENGILREAAEKNRFSKRADEDCPVSVLQRGQSLRLFEELGPQPGVWDSRFPELSSRDWIGCDIALKAGLRVSEVRNLKVSKFKTIWSRAINPLKRYPISILGKGGVQRTAKFPGELLLDIKAYAEGERAFIIRECGGEDSDFLILNPASIPVYGGKPVSVRTMQRAFADACVRSGLYSEEAVEDISWGPFGICRNDKLKKIPSFVYHDLRHTFAVWTYYILKKSGISEPWLDISACLGHAHLSTTTDIYLRGAPDFESTVSDDYEAELNAI